MFFRRESPHVPSFDERLEILKQHGFEITREEPGRARVSRNGCAAVIEDVPGDHPRVNKAGVLTGEEIGLVVHGGYQMFVRTPSGRTRPALASQLKTLHSFEEDLREGLGLVSLYNTSLGTVCDLHLYDRLEDRDLGAEHPWEHKGHSVS